MKYFISFILFLSIILNIIFVIDYNKFKKEQIQFQDQTDESINLLTELVK